MLRKLLIILVFLLTAAVGFAADSPLRCKITVPTAYAIVRGDVPVYGFAEGEGFKEYKLEYGAGENPRSWTLVTTSTTPQKEPKSEPKVDFDLVKTVPGNLGMWPIGLTEYQYEEQKVDLEPGTYTLRLTVKDKKGKTIEDKVIVEVGRVFLNSIGGKIVSGDKQARFSLPEHSLYQAVDVFSLKSWDIEAQKLGAGFECLGNVYELSPPELHFTRKGTLSFAIEKWQSVQRNLFIFQYNPDNREWLRMETFLDENNQEIETYVNHTADKFSLFVVGKLVNKQNMIKPGGLEHEALCSGQTRTGVLCHNSFKDGFGQWENQYGDVGAILELDSTQGQNAPCLKLTNMKLDSSFAATVRKKPYDARQYPVISFDYKIPKGIKINLLAKANNVWYDLVFTDDEKIYWDINMEKIGTIENVQADNQWHHAELNLYEILEKYYRDKYIYAKDYIVRELCFADWDSTGFMKLEFGHNPQGVSYYIDNFMIKSKEEKK